MCLSQDSESFLFVYLGEIFLFNLFNKLLSFKKPNSITLTLFTYVLELKKQYLIKKIQIPGLKACDLISNSQVRWK